MKVPWQGPRAAAYGKSTAKFLLQPQSIARRVLPARLFTKLWEFANHRVPTDCGEDWTQDMINRALEAGPHPSATTPIRVTLLWEDVAYQEAAKFVKIIPESVLFVHKTPKDLKVSRVAVVPQTNHWDRIILNLLAEVKFPETRRKRQRVHPSVNETTKLRRTKQPLGNWGKPRWPC